MGAVAALLLLRHQGTGSAFIAAAGLIGFVLALVIGLNESGRMIWDRVWAFGIPSVLLLSGLVLLERQNPIPVPQWMVNLGDWSYSLYLSHLIVLLALRRIWQSLPLPDALAFTGPGPWDNIAFPVIEKTLRCYLADRDEGKFSFQIQPIRERLKTD